jgi:cyclase
MRSVAFLGAAVFAITTSALAQAPRQDPAAGPDHTVEVAPGLYTVTWGNNFGNMGLNVGVSVGDDGVLLVDAQEEGGVPRLVSRIAEITSKPVRYVVSSHWHFDHIGGNATFGKAGATVIAQENTRKRLMGEQANPIPGRGAQRAYAAAFWPTLSFKDSLTLHFNNDDIEVLHFPSTHTDADSVALFRKANVLFATAIFNNGTYTRVDLRGGSIEGQIAAFNKLLPMLDDKVKVVPGRGAVATKADMAAYRDVMVTLRDRVTKAIRDGKSLAETVAAKPTAEFDGRWGNGPIRPDQWVEEIYWDLKRTVR